MLRLDIYSLSLFALVFSTAVSSQDFMLNDAQKMQAQQLLMPPVNLYYANPPFFKGRGPASPVPCPPYCDEKHYESRIPPWTLGWNPPAYPSYSPYRLY